jgi:predicted  nucleic acid-binding Zn-ribbon protein
LPFNTHQTIKYSALLILVILCWFSHFDLYIVDFIDHALVQSGIVYASARSVNAVISLLQSAEVGIGIASIQPAQLLDPINDLAEYMSNSMRIALGTLFVQRILFTLSSETFFSVMFTFSVLIYALSDYFAYGKRFSTKILASLVLIRFMVPLVVISTGLASQMFLDRQIDTQNQAVTDKVDHLSAQANATSTLSSSARKDIADQKTTLLNALSTVSDKKAQFLNQINENQQQLIALTSKITAIQATRNLTEKLTMTELENAKPLIVLKQTLKQQQAQLNNGIVALNTETTRLTQQIHTLDNQLAENTGDMMGNVADAVASGINNIIESMEKLFIDFLSLLSLLVVKLILMPSLFLYLFLKAFKAIWRHTQLNITPALHSK